MIFKMMLFLERNHMTVATLLLLLRNNLLQKVSKCCRALNIHTTGVSVDSVLLSVSLRLVPGSNQLPEILSHHVLANADPGRTVFKIFSLVLRWCLDVAPVAPHLARWASSSIMVARALSGTSSQLPPPLSASLRSERPQRSAAFPSILSLDDAAAWISADRGLCKPARPWTESSASKVSSQRRTTTKHPPSPRRVWRRLPLCWGRHWSCWSALCACCATRVNTSPTSWPATIAPALTACDSTCASKSPSPESTSAARSAPSASTPTTFSWS